MFDPLILLLLLFLILLYLLVKLYFVFLLFWRLLNNFNTFPCFFNYLTCTTFCCCHCCIICLSCTTCCRCWTIGGASFWFFCISLLFLFFLCEIWQAKRFWNKNVFHCQIITILLLLLILGTKEKKPKSMGLATIGVSPSVVPCFLDWFFLILVGVSSFVSCFEIVSRACLAQNP